MNKFASASYPVVPWENICEVEHDGIVIIISCQPLRRPRYSFKIGVRAAPGKFGTHFQSRVSRDETSGELSIQHANTQALVTAIQMAEEKIMAMVIQDQEDFESSERAASSSPRDVSSPR